MELYHSTQFSSLRGGHTWPTVLDDVLTPGNSTYSMYALFFWYKTCVGSTKNSPEFPGVPKVVVHVWWPDHSHLSVVRA
jgi:hypothetical protein